VTDAIGGINPPLSPIATLYPRVVSRKSWLDEAERVTPGRGITRGVLDPGFPSPVFPVIRITHALLGHYPEV
jgi:hypothetical protein